MWFLDVTLQYILPRVGGAGSKNPIHIPQRVYEQFKCQEFKCTMKAIQVVRYMLTIENSADILQERKY